VHGLRELSIHQRDMWTIRGFLSKFLLLLDDIHPANQYLEQLSLAGSHVNLSLLDKDGFEVLRWTALRHFSCLSYFPFWGSAFEIVLHFAKYLPASLVSFEPLSEDFGPTEEDGLCIAIDKFHLSSQRCFDLAFFMPTLHMMRSLCYYNVSPAKTHHFVRARHALV